MTIEREAVRRRRNRVYASLSEMAAPLLRFATRQYVRAQPVPPSQWRTLAIFGAGHIGDTLFRTASLPTLRRALPACRIIYVCSPVGAELLNTNPNVDEALPLVREGTKWRGQRATMDALRERAIDAALCTDHIAYHEDLLLAVRARIPARVSFVHKGLSGLVTHAVRARYPRPFPAYTRALVASIAGVPEDWSLQPRVYVRPGDERDAAETWRELGLDESTPVVACTMTVRQRGAAVWPPDRFIEALALVARRRPLQVVLCGSGDDASALTAAARQAPPSLTCRVMAGRLSLLGFAAFLQRCDALLASDSGPRHLANAVGTPVVFVRSLNVSQREATVYCDSETDVAPDGEFLPVAAQVQALRSLRPADVALALDRAMARWAARGG
jgi:ADP-heptose:LPS heptosyltransferase